MLQVTLVMRYGIGLINKMHTVCHSWYNNTKIFMCKRNPKAIQLCKSITSLSGFRARYTCSLWKASSYSNEIREV